MSIHRSTLLIFTLQGCSWAQVVVALCILSLEKIIPLLLQIGSSDDLDLLRRYRRQTFVFPFFDQGLQIYVLQPQFLQVFLIVGFQCIFFHFIIFSIVLASQYSLCVSHMLGFLLIFLLILCHFQLLLWTYYFNISQLLKDYVLICVIVNCRGGVPIAFFWLFYFYKLYGKIHLDLEFDFLGLLARHGWQDNPWIDDHVHDICGI